MPRQRVPPNPLTVALGPLHHPVPGGEVELPPVRLRGIHLHLVLGRDHVELTSRDRRVPAITQPTRSDRRTEVPTTLLGRPTQRRRPTRLPRPRGRGRS